MVVLALFTALALICIGGVCYSYLLIREVRRLL